MLAAKERAIVSMAVRFIFVAESDLVWWLIVDAPMGYVVAFLDEIQVVCIPHSIRTWLV